MTLHLHHLLGCAPAPLAHYLKALGILRIVAEQKDAEVRGWWQDEHFCLLTNLDAEQLERFLLDEYAPTPIFNPWGARSGFYPGSSEKTARAALEKIERSSLSRLHPFQKTIQTIRFAVNANGKKKPDTDEAERSFVDILRNEIRGPGQDWMSAVVALVGDAYKKPALLGTGGNEGSGSYVSAYLNAVTVCTIDRTADGALGVFSASSPVNKYTWDGSFGQFLPGAEASAWDFLFMLEGATLLRSTVSQRSLSGQQGSQRFLSSPFYFEPHAAGAGTSAPLDEFSLQKGRPNPGRGEQWFPLWSVPARLSEIEAMFAEGKCSIGRRQAGRSIDAARAVSRLGVARGVTAFFRYGYLQRNNLATHYAVPLARIDVRARRNAPLIDDIAPWLQALRRLSRDKQSSAGLAQAERKLATAVFTALSHDDAPDRWQAILLAAADVESIQAAGPAFKAGPIPELAPEWLVAADDGSVEWRLARCLGSAAGWYDKRHRPHDPVRHHWLPLQPGARRFLENDRRLAHDTRVVMMGRDAALDLAALVERRLVEAMQRGQRSLPLIAASGCEAHPADIAALIAGGVDLERVSQLARALNAIRWDRWQPRWTTQPNSVDLPDEAWIALRLSCLPWPLAKNRAIATDGAILRRLRAGDGATAVELSLRRLRAVGMRPPIRAAFADPQTACLWAAALAFPISPHWARKLAQRFEPPHQKEAQ